MFGEVLLEVCAKCEYNDIQTAIDTAPPGSTVYVYEGIYKLEKQIEINKPVRLLAIKKKDNDKIVIDGNKIKNVIYVSNTYDVEVSGFIITNSGTSDIEEYAGIYIENSKNCKIYQNYLIHNTYGIYLAYVQNSLIDKNFIIAEAKSEVLDGNGIHLWYSYDNILSNNVIKGHRDGLYFEYSENLLVSNNKSMFNLRYGIHFMFSHRTKIINNYFLGNPTGAALMYSSNLELLRNHIEYSWGSSFKSILLKDINSSRIESNFFYRTTVGIYSENSNRNQIYNNIFKKNGIALEVMGNSYTNKFNKNIFLENLFDVTTNSRENPNEYKENYKGYDLNKDGYGDIKYRPVTLIGYWIARLPELSIFVFSPFAQFLELLENIFPVITPSQLVDEKPLVKIPENMLNWSNL